MYSTTESINGAIILCNNIEEFKTDNDTIQIIKNTLMKNKNLNLNIKVPSKLNFAPFHLIFNIDDETVLLDVVKLFLEYGADPNIMGPQNTTPVHIAAALGHLAVLDLLLRNGGDPNLRTVEEKNALFLAVEFNHFECSMLLLDYNTDDDKSLSSDYEDCHSNCSLCLNSIYIFTPQVVAEYIDDNAKRCENNKWLKNEENKKLQLLETNNTDEADAVIINDTVSESYFSFSTISMLQHQNKQFSQESGVLSMEPSLSDSSDEENSLLERNISQISDELTETSCDDEDQSTIYKFINFEDTINNQAQVEVFKYEDRDYNVRLYEWKTCNLSDSTSSSNNKLSISSLTSELPSDFDYDDENLRRELILLGFSPGPITQTTKKVYLKKLYQLRKKNPSSTQIQIINNELPLQIAIKVYSTELTKTFEFLSLRCNEELKLLEKKAMEQFQATNSLKKWREGKSKTSFNYILLDPRITLNLPHRYETLTDLECWTVFLSSIFYIGKGKRGRPFQHLYEANTMWNQGVICSSTSEEITTSKKLQKILEIWKSGYGVVCLHVFSNVIPVEAFTREGAMINAISLTSLTNEKCGDFYGISSTWKQSEKNKLGIYLLYKALMIFLYEGERQLRPNEI